MTSALVAPPAVSSDDGSWHNTGAGAFSQTQPAVTIGDADALNNGRHAWVRFPSVGIPAGATVDEFVVSLRAVGVTGTIPSMTISANAVVVPGAPTSRSDANTRVLTTATVPWTPATWVAGVRSLTPNLAPIVQEIINLPGWASGFPMLFFFKVPEDAFISANLISFSAVDAGVPENVATVESDYTGGTGGVNRTDGHTLQWHMNRLAGTLFKNVPTRDAQGAANIWANTTGLDLVHALNVKAGNSLPQYRELAGVLNQLAGTTGLEVDGAAASIP